LRDQNESAIDDSDDKKTKDSGAFNSNQETDKKASTTSQEQKDKNALQMKALGSGDE